MARRARVSRALPEAIFLSVKGPVRNLGLAGRTAWRTLAKSSYPAMLGWGG